MGGVLIGVSDADACFKRLSEAEVSENIFDGTVRGPDIIYAMDALRS